MISGAGTISEAVDAMRQGALDFMEKPLTGESVALRIRRALREEQLKERCERLTAEIAPGARLVGRSRAVREIIERIGLVGPTDARVLVTGESGTGKEIVARAIHDASARRQEPFVTVNCAAVPRELVESELFGHQQGAFTGATRTRRGRFELAGGGTLFLDEIGDMPRDAQPKLLRALEEAEIERVGGDSPIPIDVRVIAATHQDLPARVRDGGFREDLFHRLNVVEIHVPPLRARLEDLEPLCEHFLGIYAARYGRPALSLSGEALDALRRRSWPGNVREVRNLMERLTILCRRPIVESDDLPALGGSTFADEPTGAAPPPLREGDAPLRSTLREVERAIVLRTLAEEGWQMTRAAKRLGIERSHLYRKLRELDIDRAPGGE
jgi:two-component system nitrogen regulation response regulator NtrX